MTNEEIESLYAHLYGESDGTTPEDLDQAITDMIDAAQQADTESLHNEAAQHAAWQRGAGAADWGCEPDDDPMSVFESEDRT